MCVRAQIERFLQSRPDQMVLVVQAWRFLLLKDQVSRVTGELNGALCWLPDELYVIPITTRGRQRVSECWWNRCVENLVVPLVLVPVVSSQKTSGLKVVTSQTPLCPTALQTPV